MFKIGFPNTYAVVSVKYKICLFHTSLSKIYETISDILALTSYIQVLDNLNSINVKRFHSITI